MKHSFVALIVFPTLFIIGCQENPVTEPVSGTQPKTSEASINKGTIVLEGVLANPRPVMNSYYTIQGEIRYQHKLTFFDPIPPNPQYMVSLELSGFATFTYFCTDCVPLSEDRLEGSILFNTSDDIYLPDDGFQLFIKTFRISGREDDMLLICSFTVTTSGITLNEMQLEVNDDIHPIVND
jgi:hypothetical protein